MSPLSLPSLSFSISVVHQPSLKVRFTQTKISDIGDGTTEKVSKPSYHVSPTYSESFLTQENYRNPCRMSEMDELDSII